MQLTVSTSGIAGSVTSNVSVISMPSRSTVQASASAAFVIELDSIRMLQASTRRRGVVQKVVMIMVVVCGVLSDG